MTGPISRQNLFKTAYNLEADLRSLIYEHLTWLSFSFYDRVQSGQLISRANSDIRSVQMYSVFAPLIIVQACIGVVAFAFMLSIDVELALIAMVVMPILYVVGLKMRRVMFPISWITQARLAEVATVVDENVNGVRVVKAFAQEEAEVNRLADAAEGVAWAYIKDAEIRGRVVALGPEPAPAGPGPRAVLRRVDGAPGPPRRSERSWPSTPYLLMMQAPFMMLGQLVMMGQRAKASAERIFEILDESPEVVERPGAFDLIDARGDDRLLPRGLHLRQRRARSSRTSTCTSPPARPSPSSGEPARASPPSRACSRASTTSPTARSTIDGHDVRDLSLSSLRANVGVVTDEPFLFSVSIRDNIAYGRPDATDERGRGRGARGARPRLHHSSSPRATTPSSASGATPCRGASASASPSRAPCWSTRRC